MASEYVTFEDLVRFHREVIAPDLDARMDARLAPIARQIEGVETRLGGRIDSLDAKVDALDAKVGSLDAKVGSLDAKVDALGERLDDGIDAVLESADDVRSLFAGAVVSLQSSMEAGFRSVRDDASQNRLEVLNNFDAVFGRLHHLATEYTALKAGVERVEEHLAKEDGSTN